MVTWLPALRKPARSGPTYHHFVSKTEVGAALRQKKAQAAWRNQVLTTPCLQSINIAKQNTFEIMQ